MRKMALFAAIVCLISCFGMSAFGQSGSYLGATTVKTTGARAGGLADMHQLCITKFGSSAHMCTVDDFFSSAAVPTVSTLELWIQPALHNCVYNSQAGQIECQEAGASTFVPETNLFITCNAWTSDLESHYGTSVLYTQATGWTLQTTTPCSGYYQVACCSRAQ